jgi:hypothetical protein
MARHDDLPEIVLAALDSADDSELAAAAESLAFLSGALPHDPPSAIGRERLLRVIGSGSERWAPFVDRLAQFFDLGVERIREITAKIDDLASWEAGPMPGIELVHFSGGPRLASADTGLVRMPPGLVFPKHRHLGVESILILHGSYTDDAGRTWGPGDLHVSTTDSEHAFVVSDQGVLYALSLEGDIWIEGMPGPLRG